MIVSRALEIEVGGGRKISKFSTVRMLYAIGIQVVSGRCKLFLLWIWLFLYVYHLLLNVFVSKIAEDSYLWIPM